MVAITHSNLKSWIAPAGGIVVGGVVALVALLIPTMMLEDMVWNSGIAAILPVAQPPLGTTARALLALGGGLSAAAVTWSGLFLLFGTGGLFESVIARRAARAGTKEPDLFAARAAETAHGGRPETLAENIVATDDRAPTVRRADAHPDAPARRPLSAKDLGLPMPPVVADHSTAPSARDIPSDLDQPLAAFDPAALPEQPREPVRPVAPLKAPALAAGERMTSVELPRIPNADADAPSIETLLRRLEQRARTPRRIGA